MNELPFFLNKSSSPKSWFQLLEAKFDFYIFSSPNKFYQTISYIPEPVLKLLSDDLVQASLSFDHYNSLKDLFIDHYRLQQNYIIRSYFQSHPIAEHDKPSEHLSKCARDFESIKPAITKDNEQIVRMFFLSSLPPDVQKIVNGDTNIDLGMLAEFANRMSRTSTYNQLTNGSLIIHGCDGRPSLFVNPPSQFEYVVEREDSCPITDGDSELDHHLQSMWEQSGVPRSSHAPINVASVYPGHRPTSHIGVGSVRPELLSHVE